MRFGRRSLMKVLIPAFRYFLTCKYANLYIRIKTETNNNKLVDQYVNYFIFFFLILTFYRVDKNADGRIAEAEVKEVIFRTCIYLAF